MMKTNKLNKSKRKYNSIVKGENKLQNKLQKRFMSEFLKYKPKKFLNIYKINTREQLKV